MSEPRTTSANFMEAHILKKACIKRQEMPAFYPQ
jgi:hypothetical protein